MSPDLSFALELADIADAITTARFRATDLRVEQRSLEDVFLALTGKELRS